MTSYATPADMLARYDARVVGDLVDDTDTQIQPAGLVNNPVLLALLADASSDIDAALTVGSRYTLTDLAGLTGNARQLLIRITCDIALAYLLRRRPSLKSDELKGVMELANQHLDRLRKGDEIFPLSAVIDASEPLVTGPSTVDFDGMNLMRDRCKNYYPRRVLPFGR